MGENATAEFLAKGTFYHMSIPMVYLRTHIFGA